jgi:hypothetical protein
MSVIIDEVARLTTSHTDWEWGSMQHRTGVSTGQAFDSFIMEYLGLWIPLDVSLSGLAQCLVGRDGDATHYFVDKYEYESEYG